MRPVAWMTWKPGYCVQQSSQLPSTPTPSALVLYVHKLFTSGAESLTSEPALCTKGVLSSCPRQSYQPCAPTAPYKVHLQHCPLASTTSPLVLSSRNMPASGDGVHDLSDKDDNPPEYGVHAIPFMGTSRQNCMPQVFGPNTHGSSLETHQQPGPQRTALQTPAICNAGP